MADNRVGQISASIFARIGDGPEIDLGTAYIPLTQRQMQKNHLDVDLEAMFEFVKASLQRVYSPDGG